MLTRALQQGDADTGSKAALLRQSGAAQSGAAQSKVTCQHPAPALSGAQKIEVEGCAELRAGLCRAGQAEHPFLPKNPLPNTEKDAHVGMSHNCYLLVDITSCNPILRVLCCHSHARGPISLQLRCPIRTPAKVGPQEMSVRVPPPSLFIRHLGTKFSMELSPILLNQCSFQQLDPFSLGFRRVF